MVPLGLVGVGLRERRHRVLERVVGPEVAGDRRRLTGPGVPAGQRPRAELAPGGEILERHRLDDRTALLVLVLADVGVTALPPDAPAEKDVARRLEPTLPGDDPLAVTGPAARSQVALVDRGLGLLDLEEERVVVGRAHEQRDERAEPDAAHADHLQGVVRQGVPISRTRRSSWSDSR